MPEQEELTALDHPVTDEEFSELFNTYIDLARLMGSHPMTPIAILKNAIKEIRSLNRSYDQSASEIKHLRNHIAKLESDAILHRILGDESVSTVSLTMSSFSNNVSITLVDELGAVSSLNYESMTKLEEAVERGSLLQREVPF